MKSRSAELAALAAALGLLACPAIAHAAPGDLDPAFGDGGRVSSLYTAGALGVRDDDSVVGVSVSSGFNGYPVFHRTETGGEDKSFGDGGTASAGSGYLPALDVGPGDTTVLAGSSQSSNQDGLVIRLLANGQRDPAFGSNGTATIDLDAAERITDIAVAPDGSVFAVGDRTVYTPYGTTSFIAKFRPDGTLDPSFGGTGVLREPDRAGGGQDQALGVDLLMDGRVELALHPVADSPGSSPGRARVVRLLSDGSLDPSFSGDGIADLDFATAANKPGLELAPDGTTYVFAAGRYDGPESEVVARLTPSGELDGSFSADGIVTLGFAATGGGAVDDQGRIVLLGYGGVAGDLVNGLNLELHRLTPSGDPDPSFSGDGVVSTDLGIGSQDSAYAIAIDHQGRILVSGAAEDSSYHLLRYLTADGPPDADGDGFLDADDTCPQRFAREEPGCPTLPGGVTIAYQGRIEDFIGEVNFGRILACDQGATVSVYRVRRAGDRLIGKPARIDLDDAEPYEQAPFLPWDISALRRPGRYYALVAGRTLPGTGICSEVRSNTIRVHRHRHRHG